MRSTGLAVLSMFLYSATSMADLPHTFSANTPARASEVNENFEYLAGQISDLKSGDTNQSGFQCSDNAIDIPYTYSKKTAPLGTSFYLGDTEYRLTKYKVVDPVNGDIYHITYPFQVTEKDDGSRYVMFSPVTFIPLGSSDYVCNNTTLSGYPSAYNKNVGFNVIRSKHYSNFGEDSPYEFRNHYEKANLSFSANVVLGNRIMSLGFISNTLRQAKKVVSIGDYDFTDDDVSVNSDFSEEITELSNLLDHIIIEKVSP